MIQSRVNEHIKKRVNEHVKQSCQSSSPQGLPPGYITQGFLDMQLKGGYNYHTNHLGERE